MPCARCEDVLFSGPMHEWFDPVQVRRLWTEHCTKERDHGLRLFGLLTMALFLRGAASPLPEAGPRGQFSGLEPAAVLTKA